MKGRAFKEEEDVFEGEEIPDQAGFDLRNKSLTNTAKREAEPKKAVLPLKSIMKEILEKPVSENAQKVEPCNTRNRFFSPRRRLSSRTLKKKRKMPSWKPSRAISRRKLNYKEKFFQTSAEKESTKGTSR